MQSKSFHLSIAQLPLIPAREENWDTYLDYLKQMKADRVFLSAPYDNICRITPEVKKRYGHLFQFDHGELELYTSDTPNLELFRLWSVILKEKIEFFDKHGVDTAFWMGHTLGHGGNLSSRDQKVYQAVIGPEGQESHGCYCPEDQAFKSYICEAVSIIASSGVSLIMLDDDFRLNLHGSEALIGCFCPLHLERFERMSGLQLTREEIINEAFCGKPNEVRRLWLETIGKTISEFAYSIEKAVHRVSPSTRIGLATAMTLWSHEGVEMPSLLSKLAGGAKPFLRTIGAPYWSKEPNNAGWIIELTRLQAQWLLGMNIELLAEGDTFPHTRYHCSAAMLHAFHQGLFAAGIRRVMNYAFMFSPPPEHEAGYVAKTSESLENYQAICGFFGDDSVDVGVNVVYRPNTFSKMALPEAFDGNRMYWPDEPVALRYLSRLGIPIAFGEHRGPSMIAGHVAEGLSDDELESFIGNGLILDATSAKCLLNRGIDIGIHSMEDAPTPRFERFEDRDFSGRFYGHDIWLLVNGDRVFTRMTLKDNAKAISRFTGNSADETFPAVVLYEDNAGRRFCIYAFDFYEARNSLQVVYNYARQEQMVRCIQWVGKDSLWVSAGEHPDMHVICMQSRDGKRLAVALQNLHLDPVKHPVIHISKHVKIGESLDLLMPDSAEVIPFDDFTCKNERDWLQVKLNTVIPPMGMLCIAMNNPQ